MNVVLLCVCELVLVVAESPLLVVVNRVKVRTTATEQSGYYVGSYAYGEDDALEISCINLRYTYCKLRLQHDYRGENNGEPLTAVALGLIEFHTRMRSAHDGSHVVCTCSTDTYVHVVNITLQIINNNYGILNFKMNSLVVRGIGTILNDLTIMYTFDDKQVVIEYETALRYGALIKSSGDVCNEFDMYVNRNKVTINGYDNKVVQYCITNRMTWSLQATGLIHFEELPDLLGAHTALVIKSPPNNFLLDKYDEKLATVYLEYEQGDNLEMMCSSRILDTVKRQLGPECHVSLRTVSGLRNVSYENIKLQLSSADDYRSFDCEIYCTTVTIRAIRMLLLDKYALRELTTETTTSTTSTSTTSSTTTALAPTTTNALALTSTAKAPTNNTIAPPTTSTIVPPTTSTIVAPSTSTIVAPSTSTIVAPSTSTIVAPTTSTIVAPSSSTTTSRNFSEIITLETEKPPSAHEINVAHSKTVSAHDGSSPTLIQWVVPLCATLLMLGVTGTCAYCYWKRHRTGSVKNSCDDVPLSACTISPATSLPPDALHSSTLIYDYVYSQGTGDDGAAHPSSSCQQNIRQQSLQSKDTTNTDDSESHFYHEIDEYLINKHKND